MKLTWQTKEVTIGKFNEMLSNMSDEQIDCDPIGQRPDIESLSKKQGIIDTVIRGYDFGELKMRTLIDNIFKYRSIDGGHRKRAIRDFINNKFKTHKDTVAYVDGKQVNVGGKFFKELPSEVKLQFSQYRMRFAIYGESMTDEQAGEIFRRTNITTDVNWQEMLNSYEDNLVAKFVREISRPIPGLDNQYHDLFEFTSLEVANRKQKYFQAASTRLRDDEFVTRFLTMLTKGAKDANWLTCSNDETEQTFIKLGNPTNGLWKRDSAIAKMNKRQVIDALDFMLQYAKAKKKIGGSGLSTQEFTMVSRFYVYLIKTFGRSGFSIKDYEVLYNSVRSSMDRFVGRDDNNLRTDTHKDSKGIRTVTECFRQYLTVHNDQTRSEQSVLWLLEEMDINNCGVIFTDNKRVFSKEQIEQGLRKQGGVDWIYGQPLDIKDAAGGHIVPHSDGGKTEMSNL